MPTSPRSRRRSRSRRLPVLVALALAVSAVVTGGPPAGANPAPLVVGEGVGVRVDETALNGVVLQDYETALQPFVEAIIHNAVTAPGGPFGSATNVSVIADVDLSLAVTPSTTPPGSFDLTMDVDMVEIEFTMNPAWPFAPCQIWIEPLPGTAEVEARLNGNAPTVPFDVQQAVATWDLNPGVSSNGVCWTYIVWQAVTNWWTAMWDSGDPQSAAGQIEALWEAAVQTLVDELWTALVMPSISSLPHAVDFTSVRTDDHGLIVIVETDATGGLAPFGGPYNVSQAEESTASVSLDLVVAEQDPVIVSIHPDVLNQLLSAWTQGLGGHLGTTPVDGPDTEDYLLPPASHGSYDDNLWTLRMHVDTPPHTVPTGPGQRPQLVAPDATFQFFHPQYVFGLAPVATFTGGVEGVDVVTVSSGPMWVPALDAGTDTDATLALVPAASSPDVVSWNPDPDDLLPFVQEVVDHVGATIVGEMVDVTSTQAFNSRDVDPCCARLPGDDRYTTTFEIT